jgi:hypothetical protein
MFEKMIWYDLVRFGTIWYDLNIVIENYELMYAHCVNERTSVLSFRLAKSQPAFPLRVIGFDLAAGCVTHTHSRHAERVRPSIFDLNC